MPPQAEQDDEILEGLDDDAASGGDDDFERKLAVFMQDVDRHIAIIKAPKKYKAEERLASVRRLGELGEIKAIEPLVLVYQKDKTPGIKEAAAQSLGMFRALQEALENDDEEIRQYAADLLQEIVETRQPGRPARVKPATLRRAMVGLTLSFVLLLLVGALLGGGGGDAGPAPETTPTLEVAAAPASAQAVAQQLSADYLSLSADINGVQLALAAISSGTPPDCTVLNTPIERVPLTVPAEVAAASPALVQAADTLATVETAYSGARQALSNHCLATPALTAAEASRLAGELTLAQAGMNVLPGILAGAGVTVPPTPAPMTATPSPTPSLTPTITVTPSPTVDPRDIRSQRLGMQQIIDTMIGSRGHMIVLRAYWTDVVTTGATAGCLTLPAPGLPQDYQLPPDLGAEVPVLQQATVNINTGLDLSRQSWQAFEAACAAPATLTQIATTQAQFVDAAINAFEEAQAALDTLPVR
ncbi:MAG: hypothetical protein MUE40_01495 [Anaerolineae bacterium]|jgi:hypothetical protein|nr:hypothetical protein [Anaerolineae bacterium]